MLLEWIIDCFTVWHMVCHWKIYQTVLCCWVWGWMGGGVQGWGGGRSGRVVLIDNGRVYQSKAADALVQVKTTTFGTNVGLNMLLNISSRYFGGLFWSRQLRGLPSSDGYFFLNIKKNTSLWGWAIWCLLWVLSYAFVQYYVNPLRAKIFRGNKTYIYILWYSSTLTWHIQLKYFLKYFLKYLFYMVNIMGADDLATQGARASASMILNESNRDNSVPAL